MANNDQLVERRSHTTQNASNGCCNTSCKGPTKNPATCPHRDKCPVLKTHNSKQR